MSRYGGMASAGRIWTDDEVNKLDDYGYSPPPRKSNARRNTAIAGVGIGALGTHQLVTSRNVPEQATSRATAAAATHAGDAERANIALRNAARATANQEHARWGTRWRHHGKVRAANRKLEDASVKASRSKKIAEMTTNATAPESTAVRAKLMRRTGAGLLAGGTALTAAALLKRRQPEPVTKQSSVSKTITQARYGGVVESGRRWRGEEKKDRKTRDVALGGAALGVGGGVTGVAAHRRLKTIGPLKDVAGLEQTARQSGRIAGQAGKDTLHARAKAATAIREHDEWVAGGKHGKHPNRGRHAPGYDKPYPGQPAGQVGPAGGGHNYLQTRLEGEAASARAAEGKAAASHKTALKEVADTRVFNATRAPRIKAARNLRRGGIAAAGLGGAVAIGAGIKAEKERRTWGRHVRKDDVDKAIDPKKVRKIPTSALGTGGLSKPKRMGPPRKSLLDMTPEERAAWKADMDAKIKWVRGR